MDFNKLLQQEDITDQFDPAEVESQMGIAIVSHVLPFLFFLPKVSNGKSAYANYISNQGLTLFLVLVIGGIMRTLPILKIIAPIIILIGWIFIILAIVNMANKKVKKLPLIGQYMIQAFK